MNPPFCLHAWPLTLVGLCYPLQPFLLADVHMTLKTWVLTLQTSCPHHPTKALTSCLESDTVFQDSPLSPHSCLPHPTWAITPHSRLPPHMATFPILLQVWFSCVRATMHFHRCTSVWVPSSAFLGFGNPRQSPLHGSDLPWALTPLSLIVDTPLTLFGLCCPMRGCPTMGNLLMLLRLWLSMLGISHPAWALACCLRMPHGYPSLPCVSSDTSRWAALYGHGCHSCLSWAPK